MAEHPRITVEFSLQEAKVLQRIIQNHNPSMEDEMLAIILYARITQKIDEADVSFRSDK